MADLHQMFDSLIGYLVGMALVEVVVKPLVVKIGKKTLKSVDESASVPDFQINRARGVVHHKPREAR